MVLRVYDQNCFSEITEHAVTDQLELSIQQSHVKNVVYNH